MILRAEARARRGDARSGSSTARASLTETYPDDATDQRLHLTSDFTLLGPLRFHLYRRCACARQSLGLRRLHEDEVLPTSQAVGRPESSARRPADDPASPPLPGDLTLEQEIADFEALKPRLQEVWETIIDARGGAPHLGGGALAHPRPGRAAQAARGRASTRSGCCSCSSACATRARGWCTSPRSPCTRSSSSTTSSSWPASRPATRASRLTLLCAHDASPRSLTEKILERPRLIAAHPRRHRRPRARLPDRLQLDAARAQAGGAARHPAQRRRPEAHPPGHEVGQPQGLPRGGRRPARWASRTCAPSTRSRTRCWSCARSGPSLRRAVIKLNDSFSGEGNAIFRYPGGRPAAPTCEEAMQQPRVLGAHRDARRSTSTSSRAWAASWRSSSRRREKHSPCAQLRVSPTGEVMLISTHDQILGGPSGQVFLGCSFPAHDDYRLRMQEAGDHDRRGAGQLRRGEPLRRGLPRLPRRATTRTGRSPPSRSTCAWAAPPTRTWPCSS